MQDVRYKDYLITTKFLKNQVNYIVRDENGLQFTLVPKDDSFELAGRDKLKKVTLSLDLIREISDFIFSYNE